MVEMRKEKRPSDTVSKMINALLSMPSESSLFNLKLSTHKKNDFYLQQKRNETFCDRSSLNACSQAILGATLAVRLRTCFFLVYSVHLCASLYRAIPCPVSRQWRSRRWARESLYSQPGCGQGIAVLSSSCTVLRCFDRFELSE